MNQWIRWAVPLGAAVAWRYYTRNRGNVRQPGSRQQGGFCLQRYLGLGLPADQATIMCRFWEAGDSPIVIASEMNLSLRDFDDRFQAALDRLAGDVI